MPGLLQELAERHPALPRILPFALLIAGIALDGALGGASASLPWDLRWDYAGRSALAALAMAWLWPLLPELRGGEARPALALTVGVAVFALWIAPPLLAFSQGAGGFDAARLSGQTAVPLAGSGFLPLASDGGIDWRLASLRLAGSALVVPLAEELFWRSFLQRWIDRTDFRSVDPRHSSWKALGLQALAFGLEHDLWLAGILAGLAYGWLYRSTGRLWPGILAHGLTNGLLGIYVLAGQHWTYW